jgi:SPP1 gp7 family putative phage head morphogenesis protein
MIKNNDYWKKREIAEKEWQKQAEKDLQSYNQHIAQMYQSTIDDIDRQIRSDLSIANGKLVTAKGMQDYETLAKEAVKKANVLRAEGHYVTRKDFSKDVNDRLKVYNATMRINRNEILKSKIGARLVELGVEQETDLTKKLWNDYTKEKERQAGILGITAKSDLWTSKEVQGQIYKQIANANFSKRIWADIDGLKGQLDGLISSAIIRGENPKAMAKWLTGMVSATIGNQRYVAERLARTETARVQFAAQKMSVVQGGYKYVKWFAEGEACKICKAIASDDVGYGDGIYPVKEVPDIPVHPNCMCSISAYWVEDDKL